MDDYDARRRQEREEARKRQDHEDEWFLLFFMAMCAIATVFSLLAIVIMD